MSVGPREAVRTLRLRLERRPSADLQAEERARARLPELVRILARAGASEVWLFGSLATGTFRADSDIDLAVDGLDERTLARLEAELSAAAGREVELTNLQTMGGVARRIVESLGERQA